MDRIGSAVGVSCILLLGRVRLRTGVGLKRNERFCAELLIRDAFRSAWFAAEEAIACAILRGASTERLGVTFSHNSFALKIFSSHVVFVLQLRSMHLARKEPSLSFDMSSIARAVNAINGCRQFAMKVVLDVDWILALHKPTSHHATSCTLIYTKHRQSLALGQECSSRD